MNEVAAIEEPRESFLDLVRWIFPLEFAEEVAEVAAAISDRRCERAIKLAVKKEFPVFRIEADRIRRQQIDAEVRCKLRNVFAIA